jgi:DNA/RNA-binding domain of Phe-tRNA-synthetase-like protein
VTDPGAGSPAGAPQLGWVAVDVEDEHPDLALVSVEVPCTATRRSPSWVHHRLGALSDRVRGAQALQVRQHDVPALHRAFFRAIGLDPDQHRTPIEEAMFQRLWRGGFVPGGMPDDALLIALVETGVAVWAVDAAVVDGPLGIRLSEDGEPLGDGRTGVTLPAGRLVVADARRALAELFQPVPASCRVGGGTRRAVLYVLQVPGVPSLSVQDALWTVRSLLRTA